MLIDFQLFSFRYTHKKRTDATCLWAKLRIFPWLRTKYVAFLQNLILLKGIHKVPLRCYHAVKHDFNQLHPKYFYVCDGTIRIWF